MNLDLLSHAGATTTWTERLGPGSVVLRGFAASEAECLYGEIGKIVATAPFRQMLTPGGFRMSVAMSNCGTVGWVTDQSGYRYQPNDPESGQPWPPMPAIFSRLAETAAAAAGFSGFAPDACLINRYAPGTRLSLHQDRDEGNYAHPIVSVSLGIPAVFLWGGAQRADKARRIALLHGDVVVWGGPARLRFHGVLPLPEASHALTGAHRINIIFRKAR